jgi:hypothetical protein
MRRREYFESPREYVEYLEHRVRFLEHRLREYRESNRVPGFERQRRVNEMAQPRHKSVDLLIPLADDVINITFVAKSSMIKGKVHRYIDMTDCPSPAEPGRICVQVYLPNRSETETSSGRKEQEKKEIESFADSVAEKYGNNDQTTAQYIRNAILSCYDQEVVDHDAEAENPMPRDFHYVKCTTDGSIVPG